MYRKFIKNENLDSTATTDIYLWSQHTRYVSYRELKADVRKQHDFNLCE